MAKAQARAMTRSAKLWGAETRDAGDCSRQRSKAEAKTGELGLQGKEVGVVLNAGFDDEVRLVPVLYGSEQTPHGGGEHGVPMNVVGPHPALTPPGTGSTDGCWEQAAPPTAGGARARR